mgnify:FL=1
MPILCKPAVAVPEQVVTCEQTLARYAAGYRDHPRLGLVLRLVAEAGVARRHLVPPDDRTPGEPVRDARDRHAEQVRARLPALVRRALANAALGPGDIDALVWVCTDALAPAPYDRIAEWTGLRPGVTRLPVAAPGGRAGIAALKRACAFCTAHPGANALVVACAFDSLRPPPPDPGVGDLLARAVHGDGIAAAVVRGHGGTGLDVRYLSPDPRSAPVPGARRTRAGGSTRRGGPGAPARTLARHLLRSGWAAADLELCVLHADSPRALDGVAESLRLAPEAVRASLRTLREYGDIGGATILDALRRAAEPVPPRDGARCLVAGFGRGAAEVVLGIWTAAPAPRDHVPPVLAEPAPPRLARVTGRAPGDRVRACAGPASRLRSGTAGRRACRGRDDPHGPPRPRI